MAESLNYRKRGRCVPFVTHCIFCLIHFVPEYQEESLFNCYFILTLPGYAFASVLCIAEAEALIGAQSRQHCHLL